MNRPFFRLKQDVRKSIFSQINHLSRSVFCFFSSRKEIVPLLFFLEEKTVGMRGKRRPSDGRTQAHPALSSVGIPQRVCLPPPPCLCPCPPRLRASFPVQTDHAKENHLRNRDSLRFCCFRQCAAQNGRFKCEPSVFILQAECAGKHLFSDKSSIPQCLLFLFFKKRKRTLLKKRNRSPIPFKRKHPAKQPACRNSFA